MPRALEGGKPVGLHMHNTRNTGYANAIAGLEHGATIFDASVGGLGGCPFAPRATGNIATEDLVYLLENEGVETGIDLDALIEVAEWLARWAGCYGLVQRAGNFASVVPRRAPPRARHERVALPKTRRVSLGDASRRTSGARSGRYFDVPRDVPASRPACGRRARVMRDGRTVSGTNAVLRDDRARVRAAPGPTARAVEARTQLRRAGAPGAHAQPTCSPGPRRQSRPSGDPIERRGVRLGG